MATKQKARKRVEKTMTEEQQEPQVEPQIEVDVQEDVVTETPLGDDPSVLFASQEEKSIEIIHAGRKWIFKYRELTWGDKNLCIDDAQSWDSVGGFNFSISKYYAAALTRMLTVTPIRPITEVTLNRLDRAIGERLVEIVPQPVEQQVPDLKVQ